MNVLCLLIFNVNVISLEVNKVTSHTCYMLQVKIIYKKYKFYQLNKHLK